MARIPQEISRQPAPRGRSQALAPFDSPVAEGVLAVGRAVGRAERQRDQAAVIQATADLRAEAAGWYAEAANAAESDGRGFADGLASRLDRYAAGIAETLPSDDARDLWAEHVGRFSGELGARANAFEIAAAGDHRARQIGRAIDTTANVVRSDPAQYEAARSELLAMLTSAERDLPSAAMAALRDAAEQGLAQAALRAGIDEDPAAVLAALGGGDYDSRLTPGQKNALINQATAERDRRAREAAARARLDRADYAAGFDDYLAFVEAGNAPDGRYSDEELTDNLGAEAAAGAIERRKRSEAFGADFAAIATASPEEEAAILAARRADLETPEDFRDEASEFGRLVDVMGEKRRQFDADRAGYVLRHVPDVAEAYQEMLDAPADAAAARRYALLTQAEQVHLGASPADTRILPDGAAAAMVQSFRERRGEAAAAVLVGQAERFGDLWPRVSMELAEAGLPDVGVVIGSMTRHSQAWAAGRIAEIAETATPDLRDAIGKDAAEEIDSTVFAELAEFRASLGAVPNGAAIYRPIAEQAERLAYDLARAGVSGAGHTAASVIVNDHYGFGQHRGRIIRMPAGRDSQAVAAGLDAQMGRLDRLGPLSVPPSLDPGLTEDQAGEFYRQSLEDGGYWATNGDESGVLLFDALGGLVLRADGTPVSIGWRVLEQDGRAVIEREFEAMP